MSSLPFGEKPIYPMPRDFQPRRWQLECLDDFIAKLQAHKDGQFTFLVSAGVASGKTKLAALVAMLLLSRHRVDRIVYVCLNTSIQKDVIRTFKEFKIPLVQWHNQKHVHGEPVDFDGAVMTYQSFIRNPELQRRLCH